MRASGFPARRLIAPALFALLVGCADIGRMGSTQVSLPEPPKAADVAPPAQREHARILAAYGGAYEDPRLEALLAQTVDKLVAASERPNLRYKATILNSPAINAFALPNGQLYVTRGLLALANDTSELSSVLSHEMAHVIARHAAIREDQVRQAALVSSVASDVFNDPQMGAMALAKSKIAMASFSRAQELEADGVGVGISARAGFDPYGAVRFLTAMGRNAELRQTNNNGVDPRFLDFLSSHPGDAGPAEDRARQCAPVHRAGRHRARQGELSGEHRRPALRRGPERGLRARPPLPASAPRLHLHGARPLHAGEHRAGRARRARQRQSRAAPRRGARAGGADARAISRLRLDRERRREIGRGVRDQQSADRDRARAGRSVVVPALCDPLRRRRLPLHLRREAADPRRRPRVPLFGHAPSAA